MNFACISKGMYIFGGSAFSLVFMFCVVYPYLMRTAPVEVDDSYVYILKAVQMKECFFQTCQGAESLLNQIDNFQHEDKEKIIERIKEPLFLIYHPLHSLIINIWKMFGFTWENSLFLTNIIGVIVIIAGVSLWLKTVINEFAAGIGLLFLSFSRFPDQGLHYVVPSNVCLGLALLMWSLIISRMKFSSLYLIAGILVLMSMHRIGIIYSAISLLLYYINQAKLKNKSVYYTCFIASIIIVIIYLLPHFVSRPIMQSGPSLSSVSYFEQVKLNYQYSIEKISSWGFIIGFPIVPLVIICIGVFYVKNKHTIVALCIAIILITIGVLYNVPGYPAELFSRTSIVFGILYVGILGWLFQYVVLFLINLFSIKIYNSEPRNHISYSSNIQKITALTFLIIFSYTFVHGVINGSSGILTMTSNMITRHNMYLDKDQTDFLMNTPENKKILFSHGDIVPITFFLVHGVIHKTVAYLQLFKTKSGLIEHNDFLDKFNASFGVSYNPVHLFVVNQIPSILSEKLAKQYQGIKIEYNNDILYVETEHSENLYELVLRVENPGKKTVPLIIKYDSDLVSDTIKIDIPQGVHPIIPFKSKTDGIVNIIKSLKLETENEHVKLYIQGVKFGSSIKTNWGWDQGITLRKTIGGNKEVAVKLSSEALFPGIDRRLMVVMDGGTTLISRFLE